MNHHHPFRPTDFPYQKWDTQKSCRRKHDINIECDIDTEITCGFNPSILKIRHNDLSFKAAKQT